MNLTNKVVIFHDISLGPFKCYVAQWGVTEGVSNFPEKGITEVYGSTLFVLRGGVWVSNILGKSVT